MPLAPLHILAAFGPIDWAILAAYMATMLLIGLAAAWRESRNKSDTEEFFLGGRSMPTWALAISIVGSSLSAATFIGAPDFSYNGNLTYLILYVGGFMAVFTVGFLFVPRLYRAGTVTIYGFLAQRFGEPARIAVSIAFLFGRMLASGARLMLVAVPLCMLIFGIENTDQITKTQMLTAIFVVGFVGTFYTVFGGIKTVVWVDVIQFVLVVGAVLLTIALLLNKIPLSIAQMIDVLQQPANTTDGTSKLKLLDLSTDMKKPFTLWAALTGAWLINTAAFGVDHDLAQRFLVAKSPGRGSISVIASQFISLAVVSLFMIVGLLLFIFYKRPDVMGPAAPTYVAPASAAYQQFMLKELPPIISGLAIAGLFAVAQGSMDSAINALASSAVADIYIPLKRMRRAQQMVAAGSPRGFPVVGVNYSPYEPAPVPEEEKPTDAPKIAVALMGLIMTAFAIVCAYAYDPRQKGFLDFALGVMTFAFSGMLAVFLTALLTRRGNNASVILSLLTGVFVITLTQNWAWTRITAFFTGTPSTIGFNYAMPLATVLAFIVCVLGPPRRPPEPHASSD
jgi:Na+/proline symporter